MNLPRTSRSGDLALFVAGVVAVGAVLYTVNSDLPDLGAEPSSVRRIVTFWADYDPGVQVGVIHAWVGDMARDSVTSHQPHAPWTRSLTGRSHDAAIMSVSHARTGRIHCRIVADGKVIAERDDIPAGREAQVCRGTVP